jgi:hypothetical protein
MLVRKIGSMATFPGREKTLEDVIKRLVPQLDRIYIYLNEYKKIPTFLEKYPNVKPVLGADTYGNLNANGKMIFLDYEESDCLVFTLDDDILFPNDYVQIMSSYMAAFNYRAGLTVHGSIIPDVASWYYERTHVLGARKNLSYHHAINLVGSGTFVFMKNSIPVEFHQFTQDIYVDLALSLAALKNNVPLMAVKRPENWIEFIRYEGLWEKFKGEVTHHTQILQKSNAWRLDHVKSVWSEFLKPNSERIEEYIKTHDLDREFCLLVESNVVPISWRGSRVEIQKLETFYRDILK